MILLLEKMLLAYDAEQSVHWSKHLLISDTQCHFHFLQWQLQLAESGYVPQNCVLIAILLWISVPRKTIYFSKSSTLQNSLQTTAERLL